MKLHLFLYRETVRPDESEDRLGEVCTQQHLHAFYFLVILGIILRGLRRQQGSFLDSYWPRL